MGRFLIEIWLLGGFLAFGSIFDIVVTVLSIFGRYLGFGSSFRFWLDFGFWMDFSYSFGLFIRFLAIGSIFGKVLAFGSSIGYWVDFL